ncbi:MAG TPA: preprotein translocase subunit SecE [Nitrospiria bacterium]|jgi:preprotein translocase subunit SecE
MIKKFFSSIVEFLKEVKAELKKTSYPTQKETIGSTTVVLIFVVIMSVFLAVVDRVLSDLVKAVIGI